RIDTHENHDGSQWYQSKHLPAVDIGKRFVLVVERTQINALNRPQKVARGQDHTARADNGKHGELLPTPEQNQNFGDESGKTWQYHRCEESQGGKTRINRHDCRQATKAIDVAVMSPVVDYTHQEKEHAGDGSVIEHLEHRTVDSLCREGRHTEHDVTHMADAGVGYQLLKILLGHRTQGAVDDVPCAQRAEKPESEIGRCHRQHREIDPQDPVGAHLEQYASEDDGDCRGLLDVGVRQPSVERKGRNLDRKPDEERHPNYVLETPTPLIEGPNRQSLSAEFVGLRHQHRHIESVGIAAKVQCQDGEQHQPAAKKGVEKELDGGILTPRSAPDANKKVHRQEHNFPKDKEEKKIEGHKNTHHARIQQ